MDLTSEIGSHLSGIERLRIMLAKDLRPGMGRTLGIRLVEAEEGRVVLEAVPGEEHYNTLGIVHGGFTATILDFACGYATLSRLPPGETFSTLELKVSYHRPVTGDSGTVRAQGTIVSRGRRAVFTEARLLDSRSRLCASANSTLLLMREG